MGQTCFSFATDKVGSLSCFLWTKVSKGKKKGPGSVLSGSMVPKEGRNMLYLGTVSFLGLTILASFSDTCGL